MIYRSQTVNWTIIPPQTGQPTAHHAPRSRPLRPAPAGLLPCRPSICCCSSTATAWYMSGHVYAPSSFASWPLRVTACLFNTSNPSWYPYFKLLRRKFHYEEKLLLLLTSKSCHIERNFYSTGFTLYWNNWESGCMWIHISLICFMYTVIKIYNTNYNNW